MVAELCLLHVTNPCSGKLHPMSTCMKGAICSFHDRHDQRRQVYWRTGFVINAVVYLGLRYKIAVKEMALNVGE